MTVLSRLPEINLVPSEEKVNAWMQSVWPVNLSQC